MAKLFHALMKERKSFISVHLMSALTSLDREHFDPLTKIVSYSIIYGLINIVESDLFTAKSRN